MSDIAKVGRLACVDSRWLAPRQLSVRASQRDPMLNTAKEPSRRRDCSSLCWRCCPLCAAGGGHHR